MSKNIVRAVALLITVASALSVADAVAGDGWTKLTEPRGRPSAFAVHVVRLIGENRYTQAWETLHPLHQLAAPRDEYVRCENLTPIPGRIASVAILNVRRAPVRVAGLPEPVRGTKVTVRIRIVSDVLPGGITVVHTVGVVATDRHWAWMLPAERYEAYLSDRCLL